MDVGIFRMLKNSVPCGGSVNMLTQEYLKSILNYNPETGIFTWLIKSHLKINIGDKAGYISQGYISIGIKYNHYLAHRLAYLWMEGYIPKEVDHINMIRNDNRWCNLREASHSNNQHNKIKYKNNTSGYKGVFFDKERNCFRAEIRFKGNGLYLGRFPTAEEAYDAYCRKALELHGEFARVA